MWPFFVWCNGRSIAKRVIDRRRIPSRGVGMNCFFILSGGEENYANMMRFMGAEVLGRQVTELLEQIKEHYLEVEGWIEDTNMEDVQGEFQKGSTHILTPRTWAIGKMNAVTCLS